MSLDQDKVKTVSLAFGALNVTQSASYLFHTSQGGQYHLPLL